MILRSLSMFGFKSFADKLDIDFGQGITSIIGPNGCGKSNIIDAVRWVFGEQKPSALRSASMQDVIFSGSQNRQPLNMAEVTLNIENNRGVLPTEYTMVAITRRIYRSGESEYRINKVPCRLRDIQNLFLDTGIGNSVYTTIENAMINQILSDKADERRMLFDEAAGIGKYKQRRKETQRQLEKTTQDLLRINDKVQEADRQVRMLGKHVEKARRRKGYADDLRKLEVSFENRHYRAYADAIVQRRKELAELESGRESVRAKIASFEANLEKKSLESLEKETTLQIASRNVSDAGDRINDTDREISVAQERLRSLEERAARALQELQTIADEIEKRSGLRIQIEKSMVERETTRDRCTQRVAGAQDELAAFDAGITQARGTAERLSQELISCLKTISDNRNALSNLQAQLNNGLERRDQQSREVDGLEVRSEEYADAIEKSKQQLANVTEAHDRLLQSREVLLSRIEKEDVRYHKLVEQEKRCEAQIDSSKSQLKFLSGLDAAFEGYETGVKTLLSAKLPGMLGTVADCIAVADEQTIPLIERVMGAAIQTVVFSSDSEMNAAAAYLDKAHGGAARMASLERLEKRATHHHGDLHGLQAMRPLVAAQAGCDRLADVLFGGLYLAPTAQDALAAALTVPSDVTIISRDGVIAHGDGTVVAGFAKREEAGLLQRKKQIKKLTEDITVLENEYQSHVHEKDICIINRDEARFALIEVDEKINRGRQEQQEQATTIKHYDTEIHNITTRIETIRAEQVDTQRRIADLEHQVTEQESRLAAFQSRHSQLEEQVDQSKTALAGMDLERRTLTEHLKNVELEMHGLNNRIVQDRNDIERLGREVADLNRRRTQALEDQRTTVSGTEETTARVTSLLEQLEKQKTSRTEMESIMNQAREVYNGALNEIDEMRKSIKADQSENERVSNSVHELELLQGRDEQEQRRIRERIYEAHEVDLESPNMEIAQLEESEQSAAENIAMFKERIKRVGEVNMAALEDFEIENARLTELTRQRDDLQNAVDDLDKAIKKLDKEARIQFVETFEQVKKNFTEMFTTLFEGGEAYLSLKEGEDVLESQIEINVRPAGKKMRAVQLLSGGERALTAISLLFSLYLVKPSAYCILDELDAPLDDANIGRFTRILRKFAEKTQFIVVTHNKRTMEAADILYGVTQQEKGISTVVSVKMDDDVVAQAA